MNFIIQILAIMKFIIMLETEIPSKKAKKKESVSVSVKLPKRNHRKKFYNDCFNPKHSKIQ